MLLMRVFVLLKKEISTMTSLNTAVAAVFEMFPCNRYLVPKESYDKNPRPLRIGLATHTRASPLRLSFCNKSLRGFLFLEAILMQSLSK
jgi:hypothetical protein